MQQADVAVALRKSLMVVLKLGGPPLILALVVGLVISLVQAVTQLNEATLAFVPKVIAVFGALALLGPFMLATLTDYAHLILDRLVAVGGQ